MAIAKMNGDTVGMFTCDFNLERRAVYCISIVRVLTLNVEQYIVYQLSVLTLNVELKTLTIDIQYTALGSRLRL
jgi:hypothetical protein